MEHQNKLDKLAVEEDKHELDKKEQIKKNYHASLTHQVGQRSQEEIMSANEWNLNKGYLAKIAE